MFKRILSVAAVICLVAATSGAAEGSADRPKCEMVKITSRTGMQSEAAYFSGAPEKAVIFVPGAVFDKESWYFLAERLQEQHIASLSLDGKTPDAVWAAVDFLKEKGFRQIILVGGSMGGVAILKALETDSDERISGIILLAPGAGSPVKSADINKLFIVAKEDRLGIYSAVKALYEDSAKPKKLVEFDGSEHAQHLFKSTHKEALTTLIVDFVKQTITVDP